jgi:hypothetical protein
MVEGRASQAVSADGYMGGLAGAAAIVFDLVVRYVV